MEINHVTVEQRLQGLVLYKKMNATIFNPSLTYIFHAENYCQRITQCLRSSIYSTLNVKKKYVKLCLIYHVNSCR